MYIYVCICICIHICICINLRTFVHVYIYLNIYTHINICIHMCVCIYIYIHTHTQTYTRTHVHAHSHAHTHTNLRIHRCLSANRRISTRHELTHEPIWPIWIGFVCTYLQMNTHWNMHTRTGAWNVAVNRRGSTRNKPISPIGFQFAYMYTCTHTLIRTGASPAAKS